MGLRPGRRATREKTMGVGGGSGSRLRVAATIAVESAQVGAKGGGLRGGGAGPVSGARGADVEKGEGVIRIRHVQKDQMAHGRQLRVGVGPGAGRGGGGGRGGAPWVCGVAPANKPALRP